MRWAFAITGLLTLLGARAAASEPGVLVAGTRVRLQTPEARLVGTVGSLTGEAVVLELADGARRAVPRTAITRVDASLGRSPARGAVRGLVAGAVVGLALGFAYKAALEETEADPGFAMIPLIGGGLGAAAGAGLGALIGHEAWREVPLARSAGGGAGAVGVRWTVRF